MHSLHAAIRGRDETSIPLASSYPWHRVLRQLCDGDAQRCQAGGGADGQEARQIWQRLHLRVAEHSQSAVHSVHLLLDEVIHPRAVEMTCQHLVYPVSKSATANDVQDCAGAVRTYKCPHRKGHEDRQVRQVGKRAPHGTMSRPSALGVKFSLETSHTCTMRNAAPATTPPYAHRLSPASRTMCCRVGSTGCQGSPSTAGSCADGQIESNPWQAEAPHQSGRPATQLPPMANITGW
jgi:hypothetical protein